LLYILDANVLIRAHADYYPIDRVPEFWDWLLHHAIAGALKVPQEIFEELEGGNADGDLLVAFLKPPPTRKALRLLEEPKPDLLANILDVAYGNPNDQELEEIGRDPFLIAYAAVDLAHRTVVSAEVSKPGQKGKRRKVPDACADVNVRCIGPFEFFRELGFSTNWKAVLGA
jgi:hypothetical protein